MYRDFLHAAHALGPDTMSDVNYNDLVAPVERYYTECLQTHGPTPQGVDWSSEEAQQARFTQLLAIIQGSCTRPTIVDYGCGYGALAARLLARHDDFRYIGFDVSESMIQTARGLTSDPRCSFTSDDNDIGRVDFAVASGIFNVRLDASDSVWRDYIVATCDKIAGHSMHGFAINMLTRYADPPLMRKHLYYADPAYYFALCKERYSRNVALLHDYDLYEFTLLVRLGAPVTPLAPSHA
jgi:SAM-dependent methyltransferase